ncbi:non-ribosomal peptide synthetase [Vallitalea sp.]|jgi:amino acid adenylation domain-containing protein|uniref:non-ribosomal peptide synthetase n=1 Tax=Vallitalea sp. TaxID=1882829 RepID=UPI0025F96494|nr:non-ribosomal peptide synthetase [Vallitalea sp.]MCT4686726.1 amino acid adenylation domain-containing protein [Vallitalea sp.]
MKEQKSIIQKYSKLNIRFWLSENELHYEGPETILTDEMLENLKKDKPYIITELSADKFCLSYNQEQMWFFDRLNPNSSLYNVPGAIYMNGYIEKDKLKVALNKLLEKHEILLTKLVVVNGMPMQTILKNYEIDLPVVDLSSISEDERKKKAKALIQKEAQIPFDLTDDVLFRPKLWILDSENSILQMTMHHIISDGWSMNILTKDLMKIYEAINFGVESSCLASKNTYQEYVENQRKMIESGALDKKINSLKKKLQGVPQYLELFTNKVIANTTSYSGSIECLPIKLELMNGLKSIGKDSNASVFQIILTAFEVLLYHYTSQDDFVIGCLQANRNYRTKNTVGYFVNSVPLRLHIKGNLTFSQLLDYTKKELQDSMEYSEVPFIKLVESMKLDRNLQRNPIFNILIAQENYEIVHSDKLNLDFNYYLTDFEKSKFDLTLFVNERNGEYTLDIEYNTHLYSRLTIKRFLTNFEVLLNSIVFNKEEEIDSLQVISDQEREMVVDTWNQTAKKYHQNKVLHKLFEDSVDRFRNSVAVIALSDTKTERKLTYQELNYRANQLAHYLHIHGVSTDTCVCIMMNRSLEMIIGLLGIMKAGAAYVPIDPNYPMQRIEYMIHDSAATYVLTLKEFEDKISTIPSKVIFLDKDWNLIDEYSNENLELEISPENMAYMIYTSGSTGQPKGTMNVHKGICNRILWMQDTFHLRPTDRILQKTTYSFDVSVWEFFWPLIVGAQLIMAKPQGHRDNIYILNTILDHKINVIHFVPSMLRIFLETPEVEKCNLYLKYVICSGEVLSYKLQKMFYKYLKAELYNLYGPTEAAIDVTWYRCTPENNYGIVPIGKPIANTQIYILDEKQRPVPIGASGEIYIGGTNLARGYWNKKELTTEKFINNTIKEGCSSKLYRTGDKARFLENGNIEFISRIDNQVKIRGIRVELGEIENALRKHPYISEAVVTTNNDSSENMLVAFIICKQDFVLESDIRDYLISYLPDYMCPAYYVFVDELKLTHNGKVDRLALHIPKNIQPVVRNKYIEPKTKEERIFANIWKEVLKLNKVGINDDYFHLGGDSIRSIQIVYKANEKGIHLSVQDIFNYHTISAILSNVRWDKNNIENLDITTQFSFVSDYDYKKLPDDLEDAYPMTMLQTGLAYHSRQSEYSAYITSFKILAHFNYNAFLTALQYVMDEQPMLRTAFDLINYSRPMQLVYKNIKAHITLVDLRNNEQSEQSLIIEKWMEEEKKRTFDWNKAPLFRFYLHLLSNSTFHFTIVEPFLDGFSVSIIATTIFEYYKKICKDGDYIPYKKMSSTYRGYVAKEIAVLNSSEAKEFWDSRLHNCEKTLLPRWSFDCNDKRKQQLVRKKAEVPLKISLGVKKIAKMLKVPVKSVLLAAHIRVMQILNGQADIVTGVLLNGRLEQKDGDRVVGLFLNTVPLRISEMEESYSDLIRRVYKEETQILPYRRYPLAQIQLDQDGVMFDVVFNFVHFYPYQQFQDEEFNIINIKATDQTYFPLTVQFSMDWKNSDILLSFDYNANDFTEKQINHIHQYFLFVLESITSYPNQVYVNHSIVSVQDKEQLTIWNNQNIKEYSYSTFQELFEHQVLLTPDKVAVADGTRKITYDLLNKKANCIARLLRNNKKSTESIIAILARRNVAFLTAILSIFKARGVYLPLHPEWPLVRLKQILEQSRSDIVIVDEEFLPIIMDTIEVMKECNKPKVLILERLDILKNDSFNLELDYSLNDLAYVIYTSGSTGKSKGAMIEQLGMINHLYAKVEELNLNDESIIAQTSSQCFDISIWQFLAAIMVGGRVEIAQDNLIMEPLELVNFIHNRRINILEIVPSLMRVIIDSINIGVIQKEKLADLKYLIVTGEAFPMDLCREWFSLYQDIPVVNAYGPTECSDDITHNIICHWQENEYPIVPIGRPIRNTKIYIMNHKLEEVPIGVSGELIVEGICIGRGYLNDKGQTDKLFIKKKDNYNVRLYKTGDLGRYLPDGRIEYLSRLDNQVKIRGFRIETGEVEKAIKQYDNVKDVVVIARKDETIQELAAYIIMEYPNTLDYKSIRSYLYTKLPEYMIPTYFVELEHLPLNQNGKVDIKALPKPSKNRSIMKNEFRAPRNSLEKTLCRIWKEVLLVEDIGIDDSFYDLGGHSIQAMCLIAKIATEMHIDISVHMLLANPSISELSEAIKERKIGFRQVACPKANFKITSKNQLNYLVHKQTSLKKLVTQNQIKKVNAVAIGYLPDSLLNLGISYNKIKYDYMKDKAQIRKLLDTPLGCIALLTLPVFVSEIYADTDKLHDYLIDAIETAQQIGARTVCLTGLLPSATEYGKSLVDQMKEREGKPMVSTGHATTVSAVVFCIEKILILTERNLIEEKIGLLGVGSIGLNSLRLMLLVLPHPKEIILCDVYGKDQYLLEIKKELEETCKFQGEIKIVISKADVPDEFYDATFMIGAVNVENILKVDKLRAGTIIIDDSAPHCYNIEQAFDRLESQKDILFTEAGILKLVQPIHEIRYMPSGEEEGRLYSNMVHYRNYDDEIMGCVYSSILTDKFNELKPIIGQLDIETCHLHYKKLRELGCTAAELCCKDYIIPKEIIDEFKENY